MTTLKWKKTSPTEWTTNNGYQIKTRVAHSLLGQYKIYETYKDGEKIEESTSLKYAKEEVEWKSSGLSYIEWLTSKDEK